MKNIKNRKKKISQADYTQLIENICASHIRKKKTLKSGKGTSLAQQAKRLDLLRELEDECKEKGVSLEYILTILKTNSINE